MNNKILLSVSKEDLYEFLLNISIPISNNYFGEEDGTIQKELDEFIEAYGAGVNEALDYLTAVEEGE